MPKKRRLLNSPMKNKSKANKDKLEPIQSKDGEVWSARGRLKGALLDVLDPTEEESDISAEKSPMKRDRRDSSADDDDDDAENEDRSKRQPSPQRQSYVLKLFDRSVDLSQFKEDSPLYPICRAWIANQPKANYKDFGKQNDLPRDDVNYVELPGPSGPPIMRVPELLPEQRACSKDNINLDYKESPPSMDHLFALNTERWSRVRNAWQQQSVLVESRYHETQRLLNEISAKNLTEM